MNTTTPALTFDYASAWFDAIAPAYRALDADLVSLLELVATESAELRQTRDLEMSWTDPLRRAFDAFVQPADVSRLAFAAAVIYRAGHWYPADERPDLVKSSRARSETVPGREHGSTWKFARYADQFLRVRLGVDRDFSGRGFGLQLIEGAIRICYNSPKSWTWTEYAPADHAGVERAIEKIGQMNRAVFNRATRERDAYAYTTIEALRTSSDVWPEHWRAIKADPFRVPADVARARREARNPGEALRKRRAAGDRRLREIDARAAGLQIERAGLAWLVERDRDVENVIYYTHTGRFCWGWREALTDSEVSQVLDWIAEFPYPYELKRQNGAIMDGAR